MSTNYNIRRIDCRFSEDLTPNNLDEVSDNTAMYTLAGNIDTRVSTSAMDSPSNELWGCGGSGGNEMSRNSYNQDWEAIFTAAGDFVVASDTTVAFGMNYGFESQWVDHAWSSPISAYATWITEICTIFEAWKNRHTGTDNYGNDGGEVVVLVFVTWHQKHASDYSYQQHFTPIFMQGNDPAADSIEVI